MIKFCVILCTALLLSACGEHEPNIDVSVTHNAGEKLGSLYSELKVTALDDSVSIRDVVLNDGKCKILKKEFNRTYIPASLNHGEFTYLKVSDSGHPCKVSQVYVVTSNGSWTINV